MVKRKTPKEYYEECKEKNLDLPIEDYVNSKTKINFKCKMGHIYLQTPTNHLNGKSCPKCAIKRRIDNRNGSNAKKTPKDYYNECKEKNLDLPIEDYINAKTKIKYKCKQGHTYSQTPHNHLHGRGCPRCNGISKKNKNKYINECKQKGYDLPIEDYVNARTKIKHKCKQGHIYEQSPDSHLRGQGCPKCSNRYSYTPKEYYSLCMIGKLDLPIEDYVNTGTKIKHKCSKGHIYLQTPDMHTGKYKQGCPICKESHGEKYIRNYLDTNNINYISQKRFDDLKDNKPLSYDFYLPKQKILIEYQGIQHYESVKFNRNDNSNLKKQQYHDKLKREYAKNNGYKLLELHYSLDTQEKVNKYLERRIKD